MNPLQQRQNLMALIEQARLDGATLERACEQVGLSARSVQRWRRPAASEGDLRVSGKRRYVEPANKLSEPERKAVLDVLNSDEYKDLPPSQVVPRLADIQVYLAGESTMYRLLREAGQLKHRRTERPPQKRSKPRALKATRPDQIYCWENKRSAVSRPAGERAQPVTSPICPPRCAASTSICTYLRTYSAARSWAGRCLTARAPSRRARCCRTSASARASHATN